VERQWHFREKPRRNEAPGLIAESTLGKERGIDG
jgi:hypothetical protein